MADRVQIKPSTRARVSEKVWLQGSLTRSHGGIRKEGLEFSGADIFDLLYGKGIVAALAGQGCGLGIVEAAQGNGAEKGKIVPHVEREAVEGHPVAHAHAERAQLAVAIHTPGRPSQRAASTPERGGRSG